MTSPAHLTRKENNCSLRTYGLARSGSDCFAVVPVTHSGLSSFCVVGTAFQYHINSLLAGNESWNASFT